MRPPSTGPGPQPRIGPHAIPRRPGQGVRALEPERAFTTEDINAAVRKHLSVAKPVKVGGLDGHDGVLAGLRGEGRVTMTGKAGDRLCAFLDGPQVTLVGSAGDFAGTTMLRGALVVEGAVGRGLCCHMAGGRARLKGRAGDLAGAMMTGGLLVLDGPVGDGAGLGMSGGTMVLTRPDGRPPRAPPPPSRLLVPRGSAAGAAGLVEVELTHAEVDELASALTELGMATPREIAEGLVRLMPSEGKAAPLAPAATTQTGVTVGTEGALDRAAPAGSASDRFESFTRELKGGGG